MLRIEAEVEIKRPVEEVWAYLDDPKNLPEWTSVIVEAHASEMPLRRGAKVSLVSKILGRRVESTFEITEHEAEKTFSIKATTPFPVEETYTVERADGGTRLRSSGKGKTLGFFKLADPVIGRLAQRQKQADLETLKEILEAGPMSTEENKAVIRRWNEEILNKKRIDRAGEFVTQDYLDHAALPGQAPGLEGAKQKWAMYAAAIPDLLVTVEDMVGEGDKVAARWTGEGTHKGELFGIPPTGKRIVISGISICRMAGGKMAEQFERWDRLQVMQQMGVIPVPGLGIR